MKRVTLLALLFLASLACGMAVPATPPPVTATARPVEVVEYSEPAAPNIYRKDKK